MKLILSKKDDKDLRDILGTFTKEEVLEGHIEAKKNGQEYVNVKYQFLSKLSIVQLSRILYEGYEVEKDASDNVLEYYKRHQSIVLFEEVEDIEDSFSQGVVEGITNVLEMYNIKIKGINQ